MSEPSQAIRKLDHKHDDGVATKALAHDYNRPESDKPESIGSYMVVVRVA